MITIPISIVINERIIEAMKARDLKTLEVLKLIKTDLVKKEKESGNSLSEQESLKVLQKMVAQRKDSIEQFKSAGRMDLVEKEQFELDYILSFLPKEPDEAEVINEIEYIISSIESTENRKVTMADMRVLIAGIQHKYPGYANAGKLCSQILKSKQ